MRLAVANLDVLGGVGERFAVAIDSAGAELAAISAYRAAREGIDLKAQLLFYGAGVYPFEKSHSFSEFQVGALLNGDDVDYY